MHSRCTLGKQQTNVSDSLSFRGAVELHGRSGSMPPNCDPPQLAAVRASQSCAQTGVPRSQDEVPVGVRPPAAENARLEVRALQFRGFQESPLGRGGTLGMMFGTLYLLSPAS